MLDCDFEKSLTELEGRTWLSLKAFMNNFFVNTKSRKMSLKIQMMHSHLDFCPENMGAVSDENGERFHQDFAAIRNRFKGKWSRNALRGE